MVELNDNVEKEKKDIPEKNVEKEKLENLETVGKESLELTKLKREKALLEEKLRKAEETVTELAEETPKQAMVTAKQLSSIQQDMMHFELEARELKIHEKDTIGERQRKIMTAILQKFNLTFYKLPASDSALQEHYENVVALAKEKLMREKEAEVKSKSFVQLQSKTIAMVAYENKVKAGRS